ncbi:hypothetical protein [Streptomyces triculaminicus]|uniref:hypothetical protein n=1 Tax=Streptomyces triculaminicus TaxID=2816232 RepID=UPI003F4D43A7
MARRRCYPSDTFDDEWALLEPLLPTPACETKAGGRSAARYVDGEAEVFGVTQRPGASR